MTDLFAVCESALTDLDPIDRLAAILDVAREIAKQAWPQIGEDAADCLRAQIALLEGEVAQIGRSVR